MTAEIAILNKMAVALAADSAVTIAGQKVFNTVNKVFALSKYQPVGIMIYGSAEFMDVPWETLIKTFRARLGKTAYNSLAQYTDSFLVFLEKKNPLFSKRHQANHFERIVGGYFESIKKEIDDEVRILFETKKLVTLNDLTRVTARIVNKHYDDWARIKNLPSVSSRHLNTLIKVYDQTIKRAKHKVFEKLPIPQHLYKKLRLIAGLLFTKDKFRLSSSGIVIAGFGEKDSFPSLRAFMLEAIVNDRMKYKLTQSGDITMELEAWVAPFAQDEMVRTFMEGIDPRYKSVLDSVFLEFFDKYHDIIAKHVPGMSARAQSAYAKKLKKMGGQLFQDYAQKMTDYRQEKHINPIVEIVASLPKDDLAAMAESLVNLTSLKRKISKDIETVGGPIDVAVISKGDGFIWIKRKHYFRPELNQQFFANYYRDNK